ncbi:MAG: UDP-2,3-diacylglucosamine diphosphatase LpxI [Planctomycetota bacterium]
MADSRAQLDLGLVAGWGKFPVIVAQKLVDQGVRVHCAAIRNHADPFLKNICTSYRVFGIGRMGAQTRFLKRAGVQRATMAGKIFKTLLFGRKRDLFRHLPDVTCLRHFYASYFAGQKDRRDDTLLNTVIELYHSRGITFAPATEFAPELLVKEKLLAGQNLNAAELRDVEFGWKMAKEMGRLDIGQTVVVKNQAVMAVEAIEGTDLCIQRAGELCQGGFTVVKVAKPEQDSRFDVPTIGVNTIEAIHQAGGGILAVEANKTIILEEEDVIESANRLGVTVCSFDFEMTFG